MGGAIVGPLGVAIALGAMGGIGVIFCEKNFKRLDESKPEENPFEGIYRGF